ncbi:MAG: outer membrane beta-barrel protein [Verrucomicrobia bacterium]|jgi:hypothetical protein|nr:outer membrane beta-barrel protein [Verrucomicrobiota bacterium]MBT7700881.1 outer membrane beta-barrel protein [Verrucomicrobiota bacterium]
MFLMFIGMPGYAQDAPGIRLTESTSISPFVEASYIYDSNVFLLREGLEQDDFYLDIVGGISLLRKTEASALNLRGWYQMRRYQEFDLLNDDTWQVNGEYVGGYIDRAQWVLKLKHGVLSDYEFTQSDLGAQFERSRAGDFMMETRTRRYRRVLDSASVGLARETRHFDLALLLAYAAVTFDTSKATLYNWTETYIQPRIGFRVSEKTSLTLSGEAGQQDSDNELDTLDFLRVRLGTYWTPSEKTKVDVGAGLQKQYLDSRGADDTRLDDASFHFDGNASWVATSKILLHVFGKNEYLPTEAFRQNTKKVDQGSVGGTYELTRQTYLSLGVSYRRDTYTAPINGVDALEELAGIQARIVFNSDKQNLRVYLRGRYEEFTSNIQEDYNQLRLTIGASLAF